MIIFSAPSGSGKTTIVRHLLAKFANLGFSISACTRTRRGHEQPGVDYHFLTVQDFQEHLESQSFVEWEEVYPGMYYGTLKSEIERLWNQQKHVLFDVDVKGGISLKNHYGSRALSVFIKVPSMDLLEQRLRRRGTESEEKIRQRLAKATLELAFEPEFDVTLVNDDLAQTLRQAEQLVEDFLRRPVSTN